MHQGDGHDDHDEEEEPISSITMPGELTAAAQRDDASDQREFEALERIAGHALDGARFGDDAARIPAGRIDDVGDAALRRDDEELVVVDVACAIGLQRRDAELVEHRARSSSRFPVSSVQLAGFCAELLAVRAQHRGRIVGRIERDLDQREVRGIEVALQLRVFRS